MKKFIEGLQSEGLKSKRISIRRIEVIRVPTPQPKAVPVTLGRVEAGTVFIFSCFLMKGFRER
jgi:hypothetical protein